MVPIHLASGNASYVQAKAHRWRCRFTCRIKSLKLSNKHVGHTSPSHNSSTWFKHKIIQEVQLQHKIPKDLIYLYSTKAKSIFITFFLENQINFSFMAKRGVKWVLSTHDNPGDIWNSSSSSHGNYKYKFLCISWNEAIYISQYLN